MPTRMQPLEIGTAILRPNARALVELPHALLHCKSVDALEDNVFFNFEVRGILGRAVYWCYSSHIVRYFRYYFVHVFVFLIYPKWVKHFESRTKSLFSVHAGHTPSMSLIQIYSKSYIFMVHVRFSFCGLISPISHSQVCIPFFASQTCMYSYEYSII